MPEPLQSQFRKAASLVPTAPLGGQDGELAKSTFSPSKLLFTQENTPPKPQIYPPTTHSPQFSLDFATYSQGDSTSFSNLHVLFKNSFFLNPTQLLRPSTAVIYIKA